MNILKRKNSKEVEGIHVRELSRILSNGDQIDTIVFDTIFLKDDKKIKCIKEYYCNLDGGEKVEPRKNLKCPGVQRFFDIECKPYSCINCHQEIINQFENKRVCIAKV